MCILVTEGDDYITGPISVTIPAGVMSVSFNVSVIDDNIFEANESLILIIDQSSFPSRVVVQPDCMAIVTIVDDDGELLHCQSRIITYTYICILCMYIPL